MYNEPKTPWSVSIMDFWNGLPPVVQTSAVYVIATLLTAIEALLNGTDWKTAVATFVGSVIVLINGFKAVSMTADKHIENISEVPTDIPPVATKK